MRAADPATAARKTATGGKLLSVQLMRAIAATAVVSGHVVGGAAREAGRQGWTFERPLYASGAGVDLFFLISGFIMVLASGRLFGVPGAARTFLTRRIIRIVPLYWAITALNLPVVLFFARHDVTLTPAAVAASFAFLPYDTGRLGNGFAFPVLDLGWTLNYEMMFYLLFAACIALRREACVAAVCGLLAVIVAAGAAIDASALALFFWSRPIILEFGAGMVVALLMMRGGIVLPAVARIALAIAALAWLAADPTGRLALAITPNDGWRLVAWGIPAAALLVAAISGPMPLANRGGVVAVALGDASYALYLSHPFVIRAMLILIERTSLGGMIGPLGFVALTLLLAMLAAVAIHVWIERPVTDWLTARFGRAPATAAPLAAGRHE